MWILLDGRAVSDPDSAAILDTANNYDEAMRRTNELWGGYDAIWQDNFGELRYDLPPFYK